LYDLQYVMLVMHAETCNIQYKITENNELWTTYIPLVIHMFHRGVYNVVSHKLIHKYTRESHSSQIIFSFSEYTLTLWRLTTSIVVVPHS